MSQLTEFETFSVFKPGDYNLAPLDTLLGQVVAWSTRWRRCASQQRPRLTDRHHPARSPRNAPPTPPRRVQRSRRQARRFFS